MTLLGETYTVPEGTRYIGLRPVHVVLAEGVGAKLVYTEQLGSETVLHLQYQEQTFAAVIDTQFDFYRGQTIHVFVDQARFHYFDENGKRI